MPFLKARVWRQALPKFAKGYKLAGEQKPLESGAKDCESQVRQAEPTFLLLREMLIYKCFSCRVGRDT